MLGILLDLLIVMGMRASLEGASDEWQDVIYPVLAITFGNLFIGLGLGSSIGLFVLVPMGILTSSILTFWCQMTLRNAIITTGVLLAAKVALSMLFSS